MKTIEWYLRELNNAISILEGKRKLFAEKPNKQTTYHVAVAERKVLHYKNMIEKIMFLELDKTSKFIKKHIVIQQHESHIDEIAEIEERKNQLLKDIRNLKVRLKLS